MSDPAASDTGFDVDSAVADIASGLGLGGAEEPQQDDKPEQEDLFEAAAATEGHTPTPSADPGAAPSAAAAPTVRPPPKSWAKETHEYWGKLDPKVQEYVEKREKDFLDGTEQYRSEANLAKQFKDIINPYKPMLAAMGVDETQAVQTLLNYQYRLNNGTAEQRMAAYQQIGRDLGLVTEPAGEAEANVDPVIMQLRQELNGVKSALTQRQQAELNAAKADAQKTVDQFASDPANAHFDEVASDMVPFINAGLSLQDAYTKAVWANPVTREKLLQERQTDAAKKIEEKTRAEGEAAKRAAGQNVRAAQSRKAPTEPKGSMDDTMRSTLKEIRARTSH